MRISRIEFQNKDLTCQYLKMLLLDNILYFCDGKARMNLLCTKDIFHYIVVAEIVYSISRTNDFYKVAVIPAKYRILYLKNIKKFVLTNENLWWACTDGGHLEIVKYLVSLGADIRAAGDYAVRWASENGHLETVKYLVSVGADIRAENDLAVRWASENGHLEIVKYLVSVGEDT